MAGTPKLTGTACVKNLTVKARCETYNDEPPTYGWEEALFAAFDKLIEEAGPVTVTVSPGMEVEVRFESTK